MPKVPEGYKEQKRIAIFKSAMHCFAIKGYQATTIDDIMKQAEVSKGAIYHYFRSKEELYLQLLEEQTQYMFEEVRRIFSDVTSASEKLRLLFRRYRTMPHDSEMRILHAVQLEFWLFSTRHAELREVMGQRSALFYDFFHDILKEGKINHEFRHDVDVKAASALFWALRDGIGLHASQITDQTAFSKVWEDAEEMFFRFLN